MSNRIRRSITAAAALALTLGATVATPPPAQAAPILVPNGGVVAAAGYTWAITLHEHANYTGNALVIYRPASGPCKSGWSYDFRINADWARQVSSISQPSGNTCNWVDMYETAFPTGWKLCGTGRLPLAYIGDGCNDDTARIILSWRQ